MSRSNGSGGEAPVRVLFVGGCGRSGTTLLDVMLGQLPSFVSVGELRFVWTRGLAMRQLCGCGLPLPDCPFWSAVGEAAFGGWDELDVEEIVALERAVDRHRFMPFLLKPNVWPQYRERLERYADLLSRLYRGISSVAGGAVVVDSSKYPPFAFLLRHVTDLDLRIAHLVRDSRGVAYSWTKRIQKPERVDAVELMQTYHPVDMSLRWVVYNGLLHAIDPFGVPRMLMHYERLVASPARELRKVAGFVGVELKDGDLSFLQPDGVTIEEQHTVAGNPMRFQRGRVPLRLDDEWQTRLGPRDRRLVTAFTWPMLRAYGYTREGVPR